MYETETVVNNKIIHKSLKKKSIISIHNNNNNNNKSNPSNLEATEYLSDIHDPTTITNLIIKLKQN